MKTANVQCDNVKPFSSGGFPFLQRTLLQ